MIITNKLSKYRSKSYCNLDMFKLEPLGHREKKWRSKDGRVFLVREMETMHLWNTFNMLNGIIETEEWYLCCNEPNGEMAQLAFDNEFRMVMEQADVARVALQYIGHELYKRGAQVPRLPDKSYKKKMNRADKLHKGFVDEAGDVLKYKDNWEDD